MCTWYMTCCEILQFFALQCTVPYRPSVCVLQDTTPDWTVLHLATSHHTTSRCMELHYYIPHCRQDLKANTLIHTYAHAHTLYQISPRHTHTHTHMYTLTHTYAHTHICLPTRALKYTHSHTVTHTQMYTRSLSNTHTLTQAIYYTHAYSHIHTLIRKYPHAQSHSNTHAHVHTHLIIWVDCYTPQGLFF